MLIKRPLQQDRRYPLMKCVQSLYEGGRTSFQYSGHVLPPLRKRKNAFTLHSLLHVTVTT
jgi:hypothetical protein